MRLSTDGWSIREYVKGTSLIVGSETVDPVLAEVVTVESVVGPADVVTLPEEVLTVADELVLWTAEVVLTEVVLAEVVLAEVVLAEVVLADVVVILDVKVAFAARLATFSGSLCRFTRALSK